MTARSVDPGLTLLRQLEEVGYGPRYRSAIWDTAHGALVKLIEHGDPDADSGVIMVYETCTTEETFTPRLKATVHTFPRIKLAGVNAVGVARSIRDRRRAGSDDWIALTPEEAPKLTLVAVALVFGVRTASVFMSSPDRTYQVEGVGMHVVVNSGESIITCTDPSDRAVTYLAATAELADDDVHTISFATPHDRTLDELIEWARPLVGHDRDTPYRDDIHPELTASRVALVATVPLELLDRV